MTVDLKEFVSQTLCQIVEGVKSAQQSVQTSGGAVNPKLHSGHDNLAKSGFLFSTAHGSVQVVQFDVALTVSEGSGTKGGIGVFAGVLSLGSTGQSNAENTSVSHVKFSVPLALPSAKE
jgi:hypothetical protein